MVYDASLIHPTRANMSESELTEFKNSQNKGNKPNNTTHSVRAIMFRRLNGGQTKRRLHTLPDYPPH